MQKNITAFFDFLKPFMLKSVIYIGITCKHLHQCITKTVPGRKKIKKIFEISTQNYTKCTTSYPLGFVTLLTRDMSVKKCLWSNAPVDINGCKKSKKAVIFFCTLGRKLHAYYCIFSLAKNLHVQTLIFYNSSSIPQNGQIWLFNCQFKNIGSYRAKTESIFVFSVKNWS